MKNNYILNIKYNNKLLIKNNYTSQIYSKYYYFFNKSHSIILKNLLDYYYFKFLFYNINFNNIIKKKQNKILFIITSNYNKHKFIDAIYYYIGHCEFLFYKKNILKNTISNKLILSKFMSSKIDYIFIPNFLQKKKNNLYKFLIQIIIIIFIHQNIGGSATIIIPKINNKIIIDIYYLLSIYYKKIYFSTKIIDIISVDKYDQILITCKFFKGIKLNQIYKLKKIIDSNAIQNNKNILNIFKWNKKISKKFILKIKKLNTFYNKKKKYILIQQKKLKNYNKNIIIKNQIKYTIFLCNKFKYDLEPYYELYWKFHDKEKLIKLNTNKIKFLFPNKYLLNYKKIQISNIGEYSITPSTDSKKMAYIIYKSTKKNHKNITITDTTCGNAGNTIHFSYFFKNVNAVEISKLHYDICKNNINLYNLKNVNLINNNYLLIMYKLTQDVIFFDPPWGGPRYKIYDNLPLYLGTKRIDQIIKEIIEHELCKIIAIKVPYNFDIDLLYQIIPYKNISIFEFKKCKLLIIKII